MAGNRRFQILLAEDNEGDVTLVREAMYGHGFDCEILVVNDGAQAISYLRGLDFDQKARVPDLVLLDMYLPKYDGEEILKVLRSTERSAQTPVVIMTGAPAPKVETIAQKHAALHYFTKPSTWTEFSQLADVVRDVLSTPGDGRRDAVSTGADPTETRE